MYEKYPIVLAVAAFILDAKKNILIVKKTENEQIDPGLWVVPGGKVYPHESIIGALMREAKEEVGLEITSHSWIGEDVFIASEKYFHAQHFKCTVKKPASIKLEKKLTHSVWMHINDIDKFTFPVNLRKRIVDIYKHK